MQVQFTARHMELTDALKKHTENKIDKLKRYMDMIVEAHVTLSVEKYRHRAEITLKGKKNTVSGVEVSDDMYLSIDKVLEKLENQLRRSKDRRITRRAPKSDSNASIPIIVDEEKIEAIEASEIVRQEIDNTIVESEEIDIKPMSVVEALMQFELEKEKLFVFRDANAMDQFKVLYRRNDGKLGLISAK